MSYTPSAHDLIAAYMDVRNDRPHQQEEARDRAERAIAKIKADAKAEVLRKIADEMEPHADSRLSHRSIVIWLRARADKLDPS